jgi:hypothetical protein
MKQSPATRACLLACAAWMVAVLIAVPRAQERPRSAAPPAPAPASHAAMPLFAHSTDCVACHNQIVTADGTDVSIGTAWRSTMMANSARDPYWHAAVRRETIDHPTHSAAIQDECAACHMPMTQRLSKMGGHPGEVFSQLPFSDLDLSDERKLASDGVSCTVCHQIAKDKLGTPESFNGGFVVAGPNAEGVRQVQGPYAIDAGRRRIMQSVTGYEQVEAPHIRESELCATCHTLITEAFGPDGKVVGRLPEQMNYQEWQHSAFNAEKTSCQACHMPRSTGPVRIASVLGDYRDGLSQHVFVGGNAFMLRLFSRFRAELGIEAQPSELAATAQATVRQLQEDTATLAVSRPQVSGGSLAFDVDVKNLTGHKFPTGYPARRTWLHVTVRDGNGRAVFESGAIGADGAIAGNDSDADGARFEPHYEEVTSADQVQIYEPILGDPAGKPTTGLLTATQYLKDNRLLPRGFDKATAHADIAVHGGARTDADFTAAGDRVRYRIGVGGATGPFTVDVELRYQSIGYRWANNLEKYDAPEPKRFVGYYRAMAQSASELVSRVVTAP